MGTTKMSNFKNILAANKTAQSEKVEAIKAKISTYQSQRGTLTINGLAKSFNTNKETVSNIVQSMGLTTENLGRWGYTIIWK
jgi:hypothetical protein